MAVTITDRRTIQNEADATTGWTGAGFGTTTTDIVESTAAVAEAINIGNAAMFHTGTSRNLGTSPGTLVYVWSFNNALQNAWDASPPPNALLLGDGTDRIAFDMAGSNRRVFAHSDGPVNWQCLVLDTSQAGAMDTAGNTYLDAGTFAGLNFAAITDFGARFQTGSKALGGGFNVAADIIRFGNDGIRVTGGATGDRGTFSELAVADRATGNQQGHGIIRAYSAPTAFGCQGPLTFGESGVATASWFEDTNVVLLFEDRNVGNDKYYFNVEGGSGATNHFVLTGATITTAGPHVGADFNDGDIDTLTVNGCVFRDLGDRPVVFSSNADATGHEANDCIFDGCGTVTFGDHDMLRTTVQNSANASRAAIFGAGAYNSSNFAGYEGTAGTAACLWNETTDPDGELDNCSFTMGTAATHALELGTNTPATITLRGHTYAGHNATTGSNLVAASGPNDAAIYNNSSKAITINVVGDGDTPSVRNGVGATTTVNNSRIVTLTGLDAGSEVTIVDNTTPATPVVLQAKETVGVDGEVSYTYAAGDAGTAVFAQIVDVADFQIQALDFTLPATDTSIPVTQLTERNYSNP